MRRGDMSRPVGLCRHFRPVGSSRSVFSSLGTKRKVGVLGWSFCLVEIDPVGLKCQKWGVKGGNSSTKSQEPTSVI